MENRITKNITISSSPYKTANVTGLDMATLEWLRTQEPQEKVVVNDDLDDAVSVFNIDELSSALQAPGDLNDDEKVDRMIFSEITAIVKKFLNEGIDLVVFDEL